MWKNIKTSYKNIKSKISAQTWNKEFELPDGSYSVSDIQYYFYYIFKNDVEKTGNPSIRIYIIKIERRITFRIKTDYYFELSTPEIRKIPGNTKSKIISKMKNNK